MLEEYVKDNYSTMGGFILSYHRCKETHLFVTLHKMLTKSMERKM